MNTVKMIAKAFCYFSPVGKGVEPFPFDAIRHFEIKKEELMFSKLQAISDKAERLCEITIKFISNGVKQQNETRDMFIKLLRERKLDDGLPIIEWLSKNTDKSSKCGLVFVLIGKNGEKDFILIARYPSEEADVLNVALFGVTAKEWREGRSLARTYRVFASKNSQQPKAQVCAANLVSTTIAGAIGRGRLWHYVTINQLICLSNLENLNAVFIQKGMSQTERLTELNKIAIQQMKVLEAVEDRKLLK